MRYPTPKTMHAFVQMWWQPKLLKLHSISGLFYSEGLSLQMEIFLIILSGHHCSITRLQRPSTIRTSLSYEENFLMGQIEVKQILEIRTDKKLLGTRESWSPDWGTKRIYTGQRSSWVKQDASEALQLLSWWINHLFRIRNHSRNSSIRW